MTRKKGKRSMQDRGWDQKKEGGSILLDHLVMLDSQPSLKREGVAASSSSVASCLNKEPGRKASSSALRTAAGGPCWFSEGRGGDYGAASTRLSVKWKTAQTEGSRT